MYICPLIPCIQLLKSSLLQLTESYMQLNFAEQLTEQILPAQWGGHWSHIIVPGQYKQS